MPRHLISDVHQRDSFCRYLLACETTAKNTVVEEVAGKENLVERDSNLTMFSDLGGVE